MWVSAHRRSAPNVSVKVLPSGVSEYSTVTGTVGYAVRAVQRSVWEGRRERRREGRLFAFGGESGL